MNRALNEYMSDTEYVYMNYVKGCIMFYSLYDTMGAKKFDKALSTYFNKCKLTVASPQSMMNCFTNAYGASLDAVFNAYLAGEDVISQGNR
ncbi:MAG: M1 family aminopeptidase, partial [Clostridia bacterium]